MVENIQCSYTVTYTRIVRLNSVAIISEPVHLDIWDLVWRYVMEHQFVR